MDKIIISNINMHITRKHIKNMYIRVIPPDGKIRIVVPMSVSDETIKLFVISRIAWIKQRRKQILDQPRQTERQYVTGESYYLWGQRYRLNVQHNSKNKVSISGHNLILQVHKESTVIQRANIIDKWYRNILKKAVPPVLDKCERLTGLKSSDWKIKNMRTKWGTCNISVRRIWLNLQLVKKTPECLEYVIIHELVHLLEKTHNDTFKNYMDNFCPKWRTIRESLNEQKLDFLVAES